MSASPAAARGAIAAGHPVTAAVGAEVLRAGGNAVDAAVAAVLASLTAEPLLTGLGAGGYLLVAPPHGDPALIDFFVEAPGRGADPAACAALDPVDVSFGDAVQTFHVGAASVGVYGTPAGLCHAVERYGSLALSDLVAPAAALAREGVAVNAEQAYVLELLEGIVRRTAGARALFMPGGRLLRAGDVHRNPELAETLERLGREGAAPFYGGDIAEALVASLGDDGLVTAADLAAYRAVERAPVRVTYAGHEILTNPPPSAGGVLIALALALLERERGGGGARRGAGSGGAAAAAAGAAGWAPSAAQLVAVMERAQARRTPAFLAELAEQGFAERLLAELDVDGAGRLGSTTHVSVADADGWACAVTCSNGEGSGIVVPGTGIHLNNVMGEEDLSPQGFHRHPPGRRMPSMMAPTVVRRDGVAALVLGSGGSNRIRSALTQTIVGVLDRDLGVADAVTAPRLHVERGVVYAEPGIDLAPLVAAGREVVRFRARNLFFGGVHAVRHDPADLTFSAAGDPRRGGAALVA